VSRGEGELLTVPKPRAVGLLSVCLTVKPVGEPDALTWINRGGGCKSKRPTDIRKRIVAEQLIKDIRAD
jgi:hypothetical protein